MKKSKEQQLICDKSLELDRIKIDAVSGAGKTSTLAMIAEGLKEESLLLVFNKSAQEDASSRFPSHVKVQTTHSLAYRAVGYAYQSKLNRPKGGYVNVADTVPEITRFYKIKDMDNGDGDVIKKNQISLLIKSTINKFESSHFEKVDQDSLPWGLLNDLHRKNPKADMETLKALVIKTASLLWKDRTDLTSPVKASHDTYMKLFQLSKPNLPFDVIYLDEAQDTTDCVLDIVLNQDHAKLFVVGDESQAIYCQPPGTMVTTINGYNEQVDKPIEELGEGDLVLAYDLGKAHLYKTGKMITKFGSKEYSGKLHKISCAGHTTKYTSDHDCVVRLGHTNKDKHVVYMMRKGDQYRIGSCKFEYSMGGVLGFGPGTRAAAEEADGLWILCLCDNKNDARMEEALISTKYGLPEVCFKDPSGVGESFKMYEKFWGSLGSNQNKARKLIEDFDLILNKPLWLPNEQGMNSIKYRSTFITPACNLVSGMLMAVNEDIPTKGKIPVSCFLPIVVEKEDYSGPVYSMEVDKAHTYFGDGILTHNCWRGAVNALEKVDYPTFRLTKSFRFGQQIADVANKVLEGKKEIVGYEELDSVAGEGVVDLDKPHTILYRTNSALLMDAVKSILQGQEVALEVDVRGFCNKLESAFQLYTGNIHKVKHEDIIPYASWKEMKEDAEDIGEIKRIVNIIENKQYNHIVNALNDHVNSKDPHVTFTTAHKSKGREWDQVVLANDFPSHLDSSGAWKGLSTEEQNLLYVACTRAQKKLELNSSVMEIFMKNLLIKDQFRKRLAENTDLYTMKSCSEPVMGDMASFALEDVAVMEELRSKYVSGDMSMEEAFEHGFVDSQGVETPMLDGAYDRTSTPWDAL